MPQIYIATGLENKDFYKEVWRRINEHRQGIHKWEITYNWTTHGVIEVDSERSTVAMLELDGVRRADFLVVLLPGGRGTHGEMTAGLILNKHVVLYAPDPKVLDGNQGFPCIFYKHPLVHECFNVNELVHIVHNLADFQANQLYGV